jgi:hypothetical protein
MGSYHPKHDACVQHIAWVAVCWGILQLATARGCGCGDHQAGSCKPRPGVAAAHSFIILVALRAMASAITQLVSRVASSCTVEPLPVTGRGQSHCVIVINARMHLAALAFCPGEARSAIDSKGGMASGSPK